MWGGTGVKWCENLKCSWIFRCIVGVIAANREVGIQVMVEFMSEF